MGVGLAALLAAVVLLMPATGPADVHANDLPPLLRSDFTRASEQGFGDRHNSWPWAMKWWKGHLYVGTTRAYECTYNWQLHQGYPVIFPYPVADPTHDCAASPADLPLRAEIWRWTPGQSERLGWTPVFQSEEDIPNPDPRFPNDMVPREYGFRTAEVFTGPDGEALYFGGVHTRPMWEWDAADNFPPPRILRTTDGVNFTPVPHVDNTFMGELPSNSFRGLTAYQNPQGVKRLFAIHGSILGSGFLIASENPAAGNDAWRRVSPAPVEFWDLAVFNGWLYGLAVNWEGRPSYTIVKTQANTDPFQFVEVVPSGGFLTEKPAQYALSMGVHDGRLYVGTVEPSEVLRINPDDTWELVAGAPRQRPGGEWLYPTSGLDEGFNNGFNDHIWRMQSSNADGQLYIGTYDASIQYKFYNSVVQASRHLFGADLFRTRDGWYVTPVTLNGFGDPFAIGIRNFADTEHGLFVGLANDSYGLSIWRGVHGATSPAVRAPGRVEVEQIGGNNVLAWEPVPNAVKYHVLAAPMQTIKTPLVILKPRQQTPTSAGTAPREEGERTISAAHTTVRTSRGPAVRPLAGSADAAGPFDWFFVDTKIPAPYQGLGETPNTFKVHPSVGQASYLYLVVAEDAAGNRSEASNLALAPSLNPPLTFPRVVAAVTAFELRGRMPPAAAGPARQALGRARDALHAGRHTVAMDELRALRQGVLDGTVAVQAPEKTDLEILVWKLTVRATWVRLGVLTPGALD